MPIILPQNSYRFARSKSLEPQWTMHNVLAFALFSLYTLYIFRFAFRVFCVPLIRLLPLEISILKLVSQNLDVITHICHHFHPMFTSSLTWPGGIGEFVSHSHIMRRLTCVCVCMWSEAMKFNFSTNWYYVCERARCVIEPIRLPISFRTVLCAKRCRIEYNSVAGRLTIRFMQQKKPLNLYLLFKSIGWHLLAVGTHEYLLLRYYWRQNVCLLGARQRALELVCARGECLTTHSTSSIHIKINKSTIPKRFRFSTIAAA